MSGISKCFNTQPPEGGWISVEHTVQIANVSTHSRPKAAGLIPCRLSVDFEFQHTAARRRLATLAVNNSVQISFNTQPPEGGWDGTWDTDALISVSTHSRPKAAGYQRR